MTLETLQKGKDLLTRATHITNQIDTLRSLSENGKDIIRLSIGTKYVPGQGEISFAINTHIGEGKLMEQQPERIRILVQATVACLLDGYRKELALIEDEFEKL